eukprot:10708764-Karenia_brevis.AAC.1
MPQVAPLSRSEGGRSRGGISKWSEGPLRWGDHCEPRGCGEGGGGFGSHLLYCCLSLACVHHPVHL